MKPAVAERAIELFEMLIRCESACIVTKTKWQRYVRDGNGDMEVAERAVFFEIMTRAFDAEAEYLTLLRGMGR